MARWLPCKTAGDPVLHLLRQLSGPLLVGLESVLIVEIDDLPLHISIIDLILIICRICEGLIYRAAIALASHLEDELPNLDRVVADESHGVGLPEIDERIGVARPLPPLDEQVRDRLRGRHGVAGLRVVEVDDKRAHIVEVLFEHLLRATDVVAVLVCGGARRSIESILELEVDTFCVLSFAPELDVGVEILEAGLSRRSVQVLHVVRAVVGEPLNVANPQVQLPLHLLLFYARRQRLARPSIDNIARRIFLRFVVKEFLLHMTVYIFQIANPLSTFISNSKSRKEKR